MTNNYNITQFFATYAETNNTEIAIVSPSIDDNLHITSETSYTYGDIYKLTTEYRAGLIKQGYVKGDRIIILMPIDIEFYALMLAIFSLGLVAVFLDPGIGFKKIIVALQDSKAKAIISIEKLLKYRWFIPPLWLKDKYSADGKGLFLQELSSLKIKTTDPIIPEILSPSDHALITFTSGSTGRAKGTNRNAINLYNQIDIIKNSWACDSTEIDFPTFPMFGFLNLCFGIKTVIPAVNFSEVGRMSPGVIIEQIKQHNVTRMSGAPRFLGQVIDHAYKNNISLEKVNNIVLGGASITKDFCKKMIHVFPNAQLNMVYGSTEAAPIAFTPLEELAEAEGDGSLVGRPIPEITVNIVKLPTNINTFDSRGSSPYLLDNNVIGEIIIKGPHVVQGYVDNENADSKNKITDIDGDRWHRTGDMGYFDSQNRLWLTGRQSDMIHYQDRLIQPYIVEQEINALDNIKRAAIIQQEKNSNVYLILQLKDNDKKIHSLNATLEKLNISFVKIQFVDEIPVDDRHNSKIDRIRLKKMVTS